MTKPNLDQLAAACERAKETIPLKSPISDAIMQLPTTAAMEAAVDIGMQTAPLIAALQELRALNSEAVNQILRKHLEVT